MPLPHPTVRELAAELRAGRTSAVEVLHQHLARISASELNAVVTLNPRAEEDAAAADRAQAAGAALGPLHGVPFTVKDTIDTAHLRTTAGSRALADHRPSRSAPVVRRLQAAGAILVGKSNCSEFALDIHTDNPLFGPTGNPHAAGRTSGGSSGGDAAAVAAGLAGFGLGTDFGGSLRWPAHCTGTCALRPTIGLLPGTGLLPHRADDPLGVPNPGLLLHRWMTVGPIARSAADLHLLLRVLAGPDGVDAGCVPVPLPHPETVDLASLRIAWCAGEGSVPVSSGVVKAVRSAAESLAPVVAEVAEAVPPALENAAGLFEAARDAEGLPEVAALVEGREHLLGEGLQRYLSATARPAPLRERAELAHRCEALRAQVLPFFERWPVLLLPVASVPAPVPAPEIDVDGTRVPWSRIGSSSRAISLLRLPSAVVPVGTSAEGLPIGVQIVGRPFHDAEVLAIASALEKLR